MKIQIIVIMLCLTISELCTAIVNAEDSIPSTELQEVEVMGERSWISEDGTLNFIPTKKEKKLSYSPGSLIRSMNIPMLRESGDGISLVSGENVEIFINGEKADEIDLSTFWPMDVKTVQYIENPRDSKYAGATYAVNFVTRKFAAGGVTRARGHQRLPNYGEYSLSSKLVYKRMTYGAMFRGIYSRDHRAFSSGETVYEGLYYDGDFHESIVREEESRLYKRMDYIDCAINAKYTGGKFTATHTFSLGWDRDPGSGSESSDTWTANLFGSGSSGGWSSSRTLTPQIRGNYYIRFSDRWHLPWTLGYIFSENKASSSNRFGDMGAIFNSTKEKTNSFNFAAVPWFSFSDSLFLQLHLISRMQWFSTRYAGSAYVTQTQTRFRTTAYLTLGWTPLRTLGFALKPGFDLTTWNIGDVHESSWLPTVNANVRWSPSRKYSLSGTLMFVVTPPSASESNPVMVKDSELMWSLGNPYLKCHSSWDAYIYNNYMPNRDLTMGLGVGYSIGDRTIIPQYEAATADLGGLIRRDVNAGIIDDIRALLSVSWSVPGTELSLSVNPSWHYTHVRDGHVSAFNSFSISGNADYTFGNCRIGITYESPTRGLYMAGLERTWSQDRCDVKFEYGNGNLYVEAGVTNIFHKYMKTRTRFTSPHFSTNYTNLQTGRQFVVSLTYTFGFGRRVDRNIDISGPQEVESSVNTKK